MTTHDPGALDSGLDPALSARLAAETRRLLDFGRPAADPDGGFGWLDDEGRLDAGRPRELWITCRMTHVWCLAHLLGVEGAADLADHGVAALRGLFHDDAHGGWWSAVDAAGEPTVRDKTAYPHAFVVLAASSALAAGRPGAGALLDEALTVLDRFHEPEHAMVAEQWDETFTVLDDYRGLNATMHAVEAWLAAADALAATDRADETDEPAATGDTTRGHDAAAVRERALRVVERVVGDLAPAHDWLLPEHFDPAWTPLPEHHVDQPAHPFRPYGATLGHSLEWARLALQAHAGAPTSDPRLVEHAVRLVDVAVEHGWAPDGADGFVYTVGWDGAPVVRERMHWVAAEAVAAAAALHRATGEDRHAARYRTWWAHAQEWFVDPDRGSWVHERSPDGGPSSVTWSGRPDVYHALQAVLLPRLPLSPSLATALRDGLLPPVRTGPTP